MSTAPRPSARLHLPPTLAPAAGTPGALPPPLSLPVPAPAPVSSPAAGPAPALAIGGPAPAPAEAGIPARTFYRFDSRRLTVGELWRLGRLPGVLLGGAARLLGISWMGHLRVAHPDGLRTGELPAAALPAEVSARFVPKLTECAALGFGPASFLHESNPFNPNETFVALMAHGDGRAIARVVWCRPGAGGSGRQVERVGFCTAFADGRFLFSGSGGAPKFVQPPSCVGVYPPGGGRSLAALWDAHRAARQRLTEADAVLVRPARTTAELWAQTADYERACFDFQVARGLYVPPTPEMVAADRGVAAAQAEAAAAGSRFPAAAAALRQLQSRKTGSSPWTGLIVLAVSLLLSAGAGAWRWSPGKAALVLGVLFVHELGHFLAMRAFGYRDLRMFFVPLLGAAVTGRHHNVPGWKKALVSLAGPVPGIVLGVGLGAWAVAADQPAVAAAAALAIFLNVFNLLPIVPLDGGWFWNAVLFCRHHWLEAGFKVLAGLACLAAGLGGHGRLLTYLGVGVLLGVPTTLVTGAAAARLRRSGWEPPAADGDDRVPPAAAEAIFAALETQAKQRPGPKPLAQQALWVFERLNARAPHWIASLGLTAVYVGALLLGIVGFVVTTLFARGGGGAHGAKSPTAALVDLAAADPLLVRPRPAGAAAPAPAGPPPSWDARFRGEERSPLVRRAAAPARHLAATFPDARAAAAAWTALGGGPGAADPVTLFGQSVVVTAPGAGPAAGAHARELAAALRARGARLVLDDAEPRVRLAADLAVTAGTPAAAARLRREVATWLALPAPWRPPAPWHLAPTDASRRAADTLLRTFLVRAAATADPGFQQARRRAEFQLLFLKFLPPAQVMKTFQMVREARQRAVAAGLERLQAAREPGLDPAVLAHASREPVVGTTGAGPARSRWEQQLRALLRPAGPLDPAAAEGEGALVAAFCSGEVAVAGREFRLTRFHCADPARELPALARYLARLGGDAEVRYDLRNDDPAAAAAIAGVSSAAPDQESEGDGAEPGHD